METSAMILMILMGAILIGLAVIWRELRAHGRFRLDPRLYDAAFKEGLSGDDPLIDVLHRALDNRTGKLRVSDAYLICGLEPGKVNQDQIARFGRAQAGAGQDICDTGRALCDLGWERARRRFDGALQYAYVKGTAAEREIELVVEYDPHMRSARIEVDKNARMPAAN